MRVAIAAQKSFEPQHVAILCTAYDHGPASAGLQQADATQNHGPHYALAEIRLRNQERLQTLVRNDQGFNPLLFRGDDEGPAFRWVPLRDVELPP
jgi:hypothetical protein